MLTPDSSRYWPAEGFQVGQGQPSFDKQYVPRLGECRAVGTSCHRRAGIPQDVVAGTEARYVEAYERSPASLSRRGSTVSRPGPAVLTQPHREARVLIRPKAGILDPQGSLAVEQAVPALGFAGVSRVHIGRLVELDVEDPAGLRRCARSCLRTRWWRTRG